MKSISIFYELLSRFNFYDYFISVFDKIETKKEILDKYKEWKTTKNEFIGKLNSIHSDEL